MKFAIISAGEGSRLAQEGVAVPKPMVEIGGEMMINRLIRIFTENGAEEIVVIVNELTNLVKEHLEGLKTDVPLKIVAKTTPSSMHSFYEISRFLKDSRFCLTTVDTIFRLLPAPPTNISPRANGSIEAPPLINDTVSGVKPNVPP